MPRPNPERSLQSEAALARRVKWERDKRGWTFDGLAKRMTDVGCSIQGSAIYKIEKGDPPRRITVDELVAFGKVFDLEVHDLLRPPEVVMDEALSDWAEELGQTMQSLWWNAAQVRKLVGRAVALAEDPERGDRLTTMVQDITAVVHAYALVASDGDWAIRSDTDPGTRTQIAVDLVTGSVLSAFMSDNSEHPWSQLNELVAAPKTSED